MVHTLFQEQEVKTTLKSAWDFFSRPHNLERITPSKMKFRVKGSPPDYIYPGLMIQYTVSPLFGIPLTWVSEITHVQSQAFFVDEQRIGPYQLWHHEHRFEKSKKGVMMTDLVTYALPFGPAGEIAHSLLVKKQLEAIFSYRRQVVDKLFA